MGRVLEGDSWENEVMKKETKVESRIMPPEFLNGGQEGVRQVDPVSATNVIEGVLR